jgi:hypothetical protein
MGFFLGGGGGALSGFGLWYLGSLTSSCSERAHLVNLVRLITVCIFAGNASRRRRPTRAVR